jgi:transcriptional/translational regulatory protein YebC/TACO1
MLEVILINATGQNAGSVEFMFDHTCNFRIPADGLDPEELELELIDFGAEVFEDEDGILIYMLLPVLEPSKRT